MTARMQDLELRTRYSFWWTAPERTEAWICDNTFTKKVALPRGVRDIRLEARKRASADSFEVFINARGRPRFKEFPNTDLMYALERFMRANFRDGYKHIRVTYVGPRK